MRGGSLPAVIARAELMAVLPCLSSRNHHQSGSDCPRGLGPRELFGTISDLGVGKHLNHLLRTRNGGTKKTFRDFREKNFLGDFATAVRGHGADAD